MAEEALLKTYSIEDRDLSLTKLNNAMTLYETNENIQYFIMWSYYLLRCKALTADYDAIPIELLVLQKLGHYNSLKWLDSTVNLPEGSEFIKRYPKAAMRLYNSLGEFPFFIKRLPEQAPPMKDCACKELSISEDLSENMEGVDKFTGKSINFEGAEQYCGTDMTTVGGACYERELDFTNPDIPEARDAQINEELIDKTSCEEAFTIHVHADGTEQNVYNRWVVAGVNDSIYQDAFVDDYSNYEWHCTETPVGEQYTAEEEEVLSAISNRKYYDFIYADMLWAIYDDTDSNPNDEYWSKKSESFVNLNTAKDDNHWDHILPWSIVFRERPKIAFFSVDDEGSNPKVNFFFEHYKTKWNEEYPDKLHMSPREFLIKAGYIPSDLVSISNLTPIKITGLAAHIQSEIWNIYEKDSDLKALFSPEVLAFGIKLLAGHLFIPRSQLTFGHNKAGYTLMSDPLMPAGAPLNAELVDMDMFGTFTTKCIDPADRKYIEDQYYRFRDNQRNKN